MSYENLRGEKPFELLDDLPRNSLARHVPPLNDDQALAFKLGADLLEAVDAIRAPASDSFVARRLLVFAANFHLALLLE